MVLHQAAIPSVPRSVADPLTSHRANVDATVVAAGRAQRMPALVAWSTPARRRPTATRRCLPKREDMPANPMSPYALQKLVGEQYLQLFTRLYGLDTVTMRYFNVFGPRQDPSSPYSGVIALFTARLLAGLPPVITGDGEQTRDFTYVDNVVDGVLRAATAPDAVGRVINVATGRQISINQLARTIQRPAGLESCSPVRRGARGRRARLARGHRVGQTGAGVRTPDFLRRRPSSHGRLVSRRSSRQPRLTAAGSSNRPPVTPGVIGASPSTPSTHAMFSDDTL